MARRHPERPKESRLLFRGRRPHCVRWSLELWFWAVRPDGVVQRAKNRLKFHADLGQP